MKKYQYETVAGVFVLIGLVCVGYMTVKLGRVKLLDHDSYPLYARFNSVSGRKEPERPAWPGKCPWLP